MVECRSIFSFSHSTIPPFPYSHIPTFLTLIPPYHHFHTLTFPHLKKTLAADGLIEMTNPASPNSPQQSYRLTSKGYAAVA